MPRFLTPNTNNMSYIERKPITVEKLACNHPKVKHIWETGGLSAIENSTEMVRYIHLLMNDETREDFVDKGDGSAITKAESFLQSLPTT